jgi:hypothetical protein
MGFEIPIMQLVDSGPVWLKGKIRPKAHKPLKVAEKFGHLDAVWGASIQAQPSDNSDAVAGALIPVGRAEMTFLIVNTQCCIFHNTTYNLTHIALSSKN